MLKFQKRLAARRAWVLIKNDGDVECLVDC